MSNTMINLHEAEFSFSQLKGTSRMNGKDSTLRTWLNRYLPNVGTKTDNGKMKYSAIDFITIRLFSELTSSFSLPPERVKRITEYCLENLEAIINEESPVYLISKSKAENNLEHKVVPVAEVADFFQQQGSSTLIVIPISSLIASIFSDLSLFKQYNDKDPHKEKLPSIAELHEQIRQLKEYLPAEIVAMAIKDK